MAKPYTACRVVLLRIDSRYPELAIQAASSLLSDAQEKQLYLLGKVQKEHEPM